MSLTKVFDPITIAGCTVPNRVVRTAHATGIGGGTMSDDLIARAKKPIEKMLAMS